MRAFYPGSFDPPTTGHMHVLVKAVKLLETVVVGVGQNPKKSSLFTQDERVDMLIQLAAAYVPGKVDVVKYRGLTVDACVDLNCRVLVRGARTGADFEYEQLISDINVDQRESLTTVIIPCPAHLRHVSSSAVKELAAYGATLRTYIVPLIEKKLREKHG